MSLVGKQVAVLIEQQYQEMEVWYPIYRLHDEGCKVLLVGPEAGKTYSSTLGYPAKPLFVVNQKDLCGRVHANSS